ncbi:MAG TPA: Crp/Fnr family transcriptional regulator [Nitrospira sp.]|nr:Crp/Fnr family transcriptional regulator [Nitrospira sp.]
MGKTISNPDLGANRILAYLPDQERKILKEHLDLVTLQTKEEVNGVNSPVRYVHFPIDCAISLMDLQPEGRVVEAAVVGMEGCTGFTVVTGYRNSPCQVTVQVGGSAFRLTVQSMMRILPQLSFLRYALSRFSATVLRETIISVGCSQFHSVEQRLGRWLLANQHRTGVSVFPFTHDFLGEQLGVQRATISEALAVLQNQNIIRYGYREIELLSVRAMGKLSCECFS